jgi:predicted GIY-YIG superfamily endonuclease
MTRAIANELHCLYRFYDDADDLLYVGITCDPARRWPEHMRDKPWWTSVAKIELETHTNRAAVLAAETAAISVEQPRYNIAAGCDVAPPLVAQEMPDACHDYCDEIKVYFPWKWRNGLAYYRCRFGHRWTCWWGHVDSGDAPENAGVPW